MNHVPLSSKAIDSVSLLRLLDLVLGVLPEQERGRVGGFLTIYRRLCPDHTIYEMLGCLAGSVQPNKVNKYQGFSAEKALRLSQHHDHVSSFQSYSAATDKWPGAVRKNEESDIFSFSGLPWKADEALVLAYCVNTGEMSRQEAYDIAKISDNDVYGALLEKDKSLRP